MLCRVCDTKMIICDKYLAPTMNKLGCMKWPQTHTPYLNNPRCAMSHDIRK